MKQIDELIDPLRYEAVDSHVFRNELDAFLPDFIYDVHVHLSLAEQRTPLPEERLRESWASEAPHDLSLEQLPGVQAAFFPGRTVRTLAFTHPAPEQDIEAGNAYVARGIAEGVCDGLMVVRPEYSEEYVRQQLKECGFAGFKPYPGLVGTRADDISIDDFLPPHQQKIADELGLVVMLHIGRRERLRDPRNIRELHELVERNPNMRLVIAHIGRAYTLSYGEPGLQGIRDLREAPNVYLDFAMHINGDVMALALDTFGPGKLLYGSDLPVCLMRGMREHHGDEYINFSDGDYLWNTPDKRKSPEEEARYTLFIYEELKEFKKAAKSVGLTAPEIADIMGNTAAGLVAGAKERLASI